MADRNLTKYYRGGQFGTREGLILEVPPSGFDWQSSSLAVVDPYGESATQEFPLGTKLIYGEETYRYCLMGGVACEVSALCQAVVPLAGHIDEVTGTAAIGATSIAYTPAVDSTDDLAENELQDGYIFIYDAAGEGHKYKILSHDAIAGAVSGTLNLVDPIRVATIAGTSKSTVMHNRFSKVIIHPSPPTAVPVGFTQQAVTASYYFWILTKGPTAMLIDGTVVMGRVVRPSEDDDGAVAAMVYDEDNDADHGPVGWVTEVGADAGGAAATFGFGIATLD